MYQENWYHERYGVQGYICVLSSIGGVIFNNLYEMINVYIENLAYIEE